MTQLVSHLITLPTIAQLVIAGGTFQLLMFATLGISEALAGRIRL